MSLRFPLHPAGIVSETGRANVPNGSAVSSYAIRADDTLSAISTSIPTLGAANCWNAVTPNGRFVNVSNAGSSTISGFAISSVGAPPALSWTVVGERNPTGATNLDIAVSADGRFPYTPNSMEGMIVSLQFRTMELSRAWVLLAALLQIRDLMESRLTNKLKFASYCRIHFACSCPLSKRAKSLLLDQRFRQLCVPYKGLQIQAFVSVPPFSVASLRRSQLVIAPFVGCAQRFPQADVTTSSQPVGSQFVGHLQCLALAKK